MPANKAPTVKSPSELECLKQGFPIDEVIEQICTSFGSRDIILSAPPGAGKSTCVPLALMHRYPDKRLLMLQPRRVVIKHLAQFLSAQLNEKIGETIGYRMRGDTRVGKNTRLTIVTEGVLTRMIQSDPELSEFDAVLFDEFHERNVHADIGLALVLESQQALREDLRIVVMSATLDQAALTRLMPDAHCIASQGRMFDVKVAYLGDCTNDKLVERTVSAIGMAVSTHSAGDVLVFLPSAKTIRQCERSLISDEYEVHTLYGALSASEQSNALKPSASGRRKIILATNIAETSLTIEGVRIVIDSGRVQQARFDPLTATTSLSMKMISQPSSIQRMGRAGRTSAGFCYRLWAATQQERLRQVPRSSIKEVDITPHLLDVITWGTQFDKLALIDKPDSSQLTVATQGLFSLKAISSKQALTSLGSQLSASALHPSTAAMLLLAKSLSSAAQTSEQTAAIVAAILLESADSLEQTDFISIIKVNSRQPSMTWRSALQRVEQTWGGKIRIDYANVQQQHVAGWLAVAFPQRVAFRVGHDEWKMAHGPRFIYQGVSSAVEWGVVLSGQRAEKDNMRVFFMLDTDLSTLQERVPDYFENKQTLSFNKQKQQFVARNNFEFASIVYAQEPLKPHEKIDWSDAWIATMKQGEHGLGANTLPLDNAAQNWLARLTLMAHFDKASEEYQKVNHKYLLDNAQQWLTPALESCRSLKQVQNLPWVTLLNNMLPWEVQQKMQQLLPTHLPLGTGQKKTLEYSAVITPHQKLEWRIVLSAKLQEMFGINAPLRVCQDKCVVTVSLLSPARRPLQTTQDLGRFWQGSYVEIAKEMRGRYPKLMRSMEVDKDRGTKNTVDKKSKRGR